MNGTQDTFCSGKHVYETFYGPLVSCSQGQCAPKPQATEATYDVKSALIRLKKSLIDDGGLGGVRHQPPGHNCCAACDVQNALDALEAQQREIEHQGGHLKAIYEALGGVPDGGRYVNDVLARIHAKDHEIALRGTALEAVRERFRVIGEQVGIPYCDDDWPGNVASEIERLRGIETRAKHLLQAEEQGDGLHAEDVRNAGLYVLNGVWPK